MVAAPRSGVGPDSYRDAWSEEYSGQPIASAWACAHRGDAKFYKHQGPSSKYQTNSKVEISKARN